MTTDVISQTSGRADPPSTGEHRIVALDGLRGVAVLSVVLFHFLGIVGHTNPLVRAGLAAAHVGWVGVDLFFALSGFLITTILANAKASPPLQYFGAFYGRRCLRIFPLYYGVILACLLVGFLVPALRTPGFRHFVADQPWMWLYGVNVGIGLHGIARFEYDWLNFTHFWTLAVEEHFYLFWPLVIRLLNRKPAMWFSAFVILASLAARIYVLPLGPGLARGILATPMSAGSLATGALVALWLQSGVDRHAAARLLGTASFLALAALLAIGLYSHGFHHDLAAVDTLGVTLLGILFACVVGHVATGVPSPLHRPLKSKPLVVLGKYSYGIYVYHHLLSPVYRQSGYGTWFHSYSAGVLAYLLIASTITAILSFASWNLYEKRFLRLKRFVPYGNAPRNTPITSP